MTTDDGSDPEHAVEFRVPGMDCSSCATKITSHLEGTAGIHAVDPAVATGRLSVRYDGAQTDRETIRRLVEAVGYDVSGVTTDDGAAGLEMDPPARVWTTPRAIGTWIGAVVVTVGMVLAFVATDANVLVGTILGREFAASHVLFVASAGLAGTPIVRNGLYSLRARSLDIDVLMSAGILASVATHHPFEGAMLAVLFSVAQLLERFSMDRARNSLRELMELSPETATLKRADGTEETVPAGTLEPGDIVVVRPGEKLPTDGIVRAGSSAIDQSPITGESVPVDRSSGEAVYAGTIAESGYLEVEVTSPADESTLARIVELIADAERERTNREQFVDRFASVYTPIVVVAAVALAVGPPLVAGAAWDTWFLRGLTLLVIACPCAFVISTPVSVVSGITSAANHGVLIKGGRHLEAVGESEVLAVDKTGTLTTGELAVTDVVALEGDREEAVLATASALERRSEHPIGEAIVAHAEDRGVAADPVDAAETACHDGCCVGEETSNSATPAVTNFEALAGRGVRAELDGLTHYVGKPGLFDERGLDLEHAHLRTDGGLEVLEQAAQSPAAAAQSRPDCDREDCLSLADEVIPALQAQGKTVVLVGTHERLLGIIAVADRVRPEAAWAVSRLRDQGVRVVMLTGDNEGTARAIARDVDVDEYRAELLPEDKLAAIRELEGRAGEDGGEDVESQRTVAMVGDGINDAPALATASVGIAMGAAGTDTALETADVALMGDDLTRLPYLYRLSTSANGVIRQNIGSSLLVKAVLAAGAPFGLVTVIHAVVIGDMGMSLAVTGNAMRLSSVEPETPGD